MPTIERRSIAERTVSSGSATKKVPKWLPLVRELEELAPDGLLVLAPDSDESLRAVKVQVSRAAKAAGRKDQILYGENADGQLEVWLREKPKQTRGPRRRTGASGE